MIPLNRQHALALLVWRATEGSRNWGGWGEYPDLPVDASYLSYDTNPCQINLAKPVTVEGRDYNCITSGRPVGKKWSRPISFERLKEVFSITDEEISNKIAENEKNERRKMVSFWLDSAKKYLVKDDHAPFIASIEQIHLLSERSGDNYFAPIGRVFFGNAGFAGASVPAELDFPDIVEWHQVRLQGKNGGNKKRVFAPVSIPAQVAEKLNAHLQILIADRVAALKNQIAEYEKELSAL